MLPIGERVPRWNHQNQSFLQEWRDPERRRPPGGHKVITIGKGKVQFSDYEQMNQFIRLAFGELDVDLGMRCRKCR